MTHRPGRYARENRPFHPHVWVAALVATVVVVASACNATTSTPPAPTGPTSATEVSDATDELAVTASTFESLLRVPATVAISEAVGFDVPNSMKLANPVESGAALVVTAKIGDLQIAPDVLTQLSAAAISSSVAGSRLAALVSRARPLTTPVAGRTSGFPDAPRVQSPGLDLVADLTPALRLRYAAMDLSATATVQTTIGEQTVPCVATWLAASSGTGASQSDPPTDGPPTGGVPTGSQSPNSTAAGTAGQASPAELPGLHCRLPLGVDTTAGITGTIALKAPPLNGVISVPTSYIRLDPSGANYTVQVKRTDRIDAVSVVVGAYNGVRRVIIKGLNVGDVIVRPAD